MRDLQGMLHVAFGTRLIPEDAEGDDGGLDRPVLDEQGVDEVGVGRGVVGVEGDRVDGRRAGIEQSPGLLGEVIGTAGGEHHGTARGEPPREGDTDLTATAEEQDGAGCGHASSIPSGAIGSGPGHYGEVMTSPSHRNPISAPTLAPEALDFLAERHLATMSTVRTDGTPHVVAVGFTYDEASGLARVITVDGSQKVRNVERAGYAALSHVDGPRWITLEGTATVSRDRTRVAEAERRYAARYREPKPNPRRVVIEVEVRRVLGSKTLLG